MRRAYPLRPIPSVSAAVFKDEELLLTQRMNPPFRYLWCFPGGVIELGETVEQALIREVKEETGLSIRPIRMGEVYDNIILDKKGGIEYHFVNLNYLCEPVGGTLRSSSDALMIKWTNRNDVLDMELTPGTESILRNYLRN
jgi:ADP-ribose pyrophosphatase YjhB (NUDIX family)